MKKPSLILIVLALIVTIVGAIGCGGGEESSSGGGAIPTNKGTALVVYRDKAAGFPGEIVEGFFGAIQNGWTPGAEQYLYQKSVVDEALTKILNNVLQSQGLDRVEVYGIHNDGCNWVFDYDIRFKNNSSYQDRSWVIKDLNGQWKIAELMQKGYLGVLFSFYDAIRNHQFGEAEKYFIPESLPPGGFAAYFGNSLLNCIEIRSITGGGIHYLVYYKNTTEVGTNCAWVTKKDGVWVIEHL